MDDYIRKSFNRNVAAYGFNNTNEEKQSPKDDDQIFIQKKQLSTADMTSMRHLTNLNIHQGTICDVCGISPIIGSRFICLVC